MDAWTHCMHQPFPLPGKILYETLYNVQVPVSEMKLAFVHV